MRKTHLFRLNKYKLVECKRFFVFTKWVLSSYCKCQNLSDMKWHDNILLFISFWRNSSGTALLLEKLITSLVRIFFCFNCLQQEQTETVLLNKEVNPTHTDHSYFWIKIVMQAHLSRLLTVHKVNTFAVFPNTHAWWHYFKKSRANKTYRSHGGQTGEGRIVGVHPWLQSQSAPQLPDPECPTALWCLWYLYGFKLQPQMWPRDKISKQKEKKKKVSANQISMPSAL